MIGLVCSVYEGRSGEVFGGEFEGIPRKLQGSEAKTCRTQRYLGMIIKAL